MARRRLPAERTGFRPVRGGPPRWTFRRGAWWRTLYSFNIREWPHSAEVEWHADAPAAAHCSIVCRLWSFATPGDSDKLLDDLELLTAFICARID